MQAFSERLLREHAASGATAGPALDLPHRAEALRRAAAAGLPGLRDDHWRYTNLRPVEKAAFVAAEPVDAAVLASVSTNLPEGIPGHARFVFVNGHFAPTLSAVPATVPGIRLGEGSTPAFGAALPELTADERFAWINLAFGHATASLDVGGDAKIELLFVTSPDAAGSTVYPRLVIDARPGSRLSLIERHSGGAGESGVVNAFTQLRLDAGATVDHYRLQALAPGATFLDTLLGSIGRDADYRLSLLSQGGSSARSTVRLALAGDGSRMTLRAMGLGRVRQVLDTAISIEHRARQTTSEQVLRAVANDRAQVSFQSRALVAAEAPGASSQQSLKGLIGGSGAEVNLRPQLEIFTDEVKANHGATTGALDENTLFYLLSRGLDRETARRLLEWAFIEDVVSHVAIPALRRQVELAALDELGNEAAREALA